MASDLRASIVAVIALTVLFGIVYPLATTGVAQVLFPNKADGSRVEQGGKVVGSRLIGQEFRRPVLDAKGEARTDADGNPVLEADPRFFQSRPSATGYNPAGTYFNNLGPNNQELSDLFKDNAEDYLAKNRSYSPGLQVADIPVDAVTTSASGVDPHISQANAQIQARRVAAARNLPLERVKELVSDHTDGRALGVLGEPGVNVLELNIALEKEQGEAA
jgi:K+-transporting ATPase ATPase C chain